MSESKKIAALSKSVTANNRDLGVASEALSDAIMGLEKAARRLGDSKLDRIVRKLDNASADLYDHLSGNYSDWEA
jgi:predicted  nucleic acid-binding Zn-ribbon protein